MCVCECTLFKRDRKREEFLSLRHTRHERIRQKDHHTFLPSFHLADKSILYFLNVAIINMICYLFQSAFPIRILLMPVNPVYFHISAECLILVSIYSLCCPPPLFFVLCFVCNKSCLVFNKSKSKKQNCKENKGRGRMFLFVQGKESTETNCILRCET